MRALLPLLLLSACGGAPETKTPEVPEAPKSDLVLLAGNSPVVELRLVFRAGSAYDPAGKEGLSWLAAHTIVEGGTEALSYSELLATLHPWAASIGVQVDKELVTLHARCHKDHIQAFLPLLRDVVLKPRLGQSDFDRLKQKAITRLTQEVRTANDEELSKLVLESVIFAGTPLAHPALGTEAGLKALSLEDVKAWRSAGLVKARLTGGVAGAVNDSVRAAVEALVAALPEGKAPAALPAPQAPKKSLLVIEQPTGKSTAISIGHTYDLRRGHADFPELALTASYFGEHRQGHGVLFDTIREKRGMNYGDYAYAEHFAQEGWGRFPLTNVARSQQYFSVWIRPVKNAERHFGLRIAMWNLDRLLKEGLSAEQMEATRKFLDGYLYLQQQTDMRRLGYALDDRYYGLQTNFGDWLRAAWKGGKPEALKKALTDNVKADVMSVVVVTPDAQAFVDAVLAEAASPKAYGSPKSDEILAEDKVIEAYKLGFTKEQVRVLPSAQVFK